MTNFTALRTAMVDRQVRPSDVTKYPVIEALLSVHREAFVPIAEKAVAYAGEHFNLGAGRVILDPRVFAKMLDTLNVGPSDLVLDIGCTTGYSAAVIAHIAEAVVGVEADEHLAHEAEETLAQQSVDNAIIVHAPMHEGAARHGPYDAIMIEGGVGDAIPDAIADQLKDGGRIVAIFMDEASMNGAAGQCRLGLKTGDQIAWRPVFDATAPVVPGFERHVAFAL